MCSDPVGAPGPGLVLRRDGQPGAARHGEHREQTAEQQGGGA